MLQPVSRVGGLWHYITHIGLKAPQISLQVQTSITLVSMESVPADVAAGAIMKAGLACCMPDWNGWKKEKLCACAGPAAAFDLSTLPLAEAAACGGGSPN